jgi:hypothetical protein
VSADENMSLGTPPGGFSLFRGRRLFLGDEDSQLASIARAKCARSAVPIAPKTSAGGDVCAGRSVRNLGRAHVFP